MIQEGVNFSLGLLTPGGDTQRISTPGIPQPVLSVIGVSLILASLIVLSVLLTAIGIKAVASSIQLFLTIFLGFCLLMLIRFIYSANIEPAYLPENLIPLIFSLLLAFIVVFIQPLTTKVFLKDLETPTAVISTMQVYIAFALGTVMFIFQTFYSILFLGFTQINHLP